MMLYIETDLAGVIGIKKDLVEIIRKKEVHQLPQTPNYYLAPLNILHLGQALNIGRIYGDSDKMRPLAIVHAGLWMYLSMDEQKSARDNIAEVLGRYSSNGMWLTPDFALRKDDPTTKGIVGKVLNKPLKKIGPTKSHYKDDNEVMKFLKQGGFKAEILPNDHIFCQLSSVKTMGVDTEKARSFLRTYQVYRITLE